MNQLEQELKKLAKTAEGGLPRPEFLARNKSFLMSYLQNKNLGNAPQGISVFRMDFLFSMISQRMMVGAVAMVVIVISASAAVSSVNALPGEALYATKLAVEATQARFVSNPAERAKVQMEFAGNRLRELEEVSPISEDISGNKEAKRTEEVLRHFSKDIKRAQESLKQAGDPLQVKQAKEELAKKAREYEKKLVDVKVSPGREVGVAALAEAEEALKGVQEDLPEEQEVEIQSSSELQSGEVGI
ncbi:MAG: DUF5667 domain-containing protein [bacterium]|nr:DUF5667 domain-containing protein [bacterium]